MSADWMAGGREIATCLGCGLMFVGFIVGVGFLLIVLTVLGISKP